MIEVEITKGIVSFKSNSVIIATMLEYDLNLSYYATKKELNIIEFAKIEMKKIIEL